MGMDPESTQMTRPNNYMYGVEVANLLLVTCSTASLTNGELTQTGFVAGAPQRLMVNSGCVGNCAALG